ncbi:hypothetical protein BC829DRAFT_401695 [Chytridium lagenaria]|nr:hypothetical protein BC829DRAFT_401695 [Chytridium lagenaria]
MYWLTLTFMDRELEKEFIVFLTRTSLRSNRIIRTFFTFRHVIVIVFIIFGVLQYLNFHIRVLSRTTFDPFVWNGYVIILFMAVYVVKQSQGSWTLVNSLSIPFVYGTLERLWRNTFLLERYLAQRNNGSSGDFDDEKTKDDEKPTISGAPFERVQEKRGVFEFTRTTLDMSKIWNKIRSQAFPEMDLENAFRACGIKPYCDASKLFTISPSLCGSKGLLIQVLRHADLPVLFVGLGLTWSRYFHEHHYSMHILMMLILAIRGISLIVYLLVNWDTQDSTRSLFMSYLVTMQFGACGPYNLIYQQHAILSIPLIIGIIIVFLYAGSVSSANNIIISSLFAISCAYMDEALERNFFSLREMALRQ